MKAIIYLLFSIRGRITRKQWWFGIGVWYLFWICIGFVAGITEILVPPLRNIMDIMDIMEVPIGISTLWVLSATSIKRLHDRNLPGWYLLIPILNIFYCTWQIAFMRGKADENKYGPAPKPLFKKVKS